MSSARLKAITHKTDNPLERSVRTIHINNLNSRNIVMKPENKMVDLAFQDLYEVIPELSETMNRRAAIPGRNYINESSIRNKLDEEYSMFGANFGEWVKRSIMSDVGQLTAADLAPTQASSRYERRPLDDMESFWLVQQAQQIAQSPAIGNESCTCPQFTPDVPQCTCQFSRDHQENKPKADQARVVNKQHCYMTAEQDVWMNELLNIETEQERLRCQKEKYYQSLAVPDPSLEYPYYMPDYHDESSIYEQEQPPVQHMNNLPEKPCAFSTSSYQRVPRSSPIKMEASSTSSPPVQAAASPVKKTSRPRLCNFLLELLANPDQYSSIVEWVDKEKGVFKFLNSSEVASQWGRRRNKPHMKYENFARSLRTYIAKGILTKPRSKLVYRFTNKVL